jgi:hypothetical protein
MYCFGTWQEGGLFRENAGLSGMKDIEAIGKLVDLATQKKRDQSRNSDGD